MNRRRASAGVQTETKRKCVRHYNHQLPSERPRQRHSIPCVVQTVQLVLLSFVRVVIVPLHPQGRPGRDNKGEHFVAHVAQTWQTLRALLASGDLAEERVPIAALTGNRLQPQPTSFLNGR